MTYTDEISLAAEIQHEVPCLSWGQCLTEACRIIRTNAEAEVAVRVAELELTGSLEYDR